ncbi:MAG: type II CAAX prenyl endopeptidase Rce1 family protein [Phycisphaerae bacterium]
MAESSSAGRDGRNFRRPLASHNPALWVRVMLVGEVLGYVAMLLAYTVFGLHRRGRVGVADVTFFVLAALFPIAMNLLHGDRPKDSGLRFDNFVASGREVLPVTLMMAAGVGIAGWLSGGFHWFGPLRLAEMGGQYVAWGIMQQYLLQAFGLRRFRQAGLPAAAAVVASAGVFALVHAPNWPLVGLTFGAGLAWCVLFIRRPNLFTLGLAHAVLAVWVYHALPDEWLQRLTIGNQYLHRMQ